MLLLNRTMAQRIAFFIALFVNNTTLTGAVNDLCGSFASNATTHLTLQTAGWVSHASCTCTVTMPTATATEPVGNISASTAVMVVAEEMNVYAESWLDVQEDDPDLCPPQCDVSPSSTFTVHFCPHEENPAGRGRMSSFHLTREGKVIIRLKNSLEQSVNLTMRLSGSGKPFEVLCGLDNEAPTDDSSCPCMPNSLTTWPFYTEDFSITSRVLVGVFSAIGFIVLVAVITGLLYYRHRQDKTKAFDNEKKDLANQNPAFESPDPMYAEIGGIQAPPKTPERKLNLGQLPFTPDPNLRLGLDARYSMDSGLYSEPADVDRVIGHGALEGPSIMRISQTSLSHVSQGNASHNPVVMNPMTPDEIDALYAKPNKGRFAQQQPPPLPQQNPGSTTRNSSNQSLPSFRDPMGSQQQIPPPLATGSRSNSHNNIYNNAPLSLPLQQNPTYSHNGSSSLSINVSTQETDV